MVIFTKCGFPIDGGHCALPVGHTCECQANPRAERYRLRETNGATFLGDEHPEFWETHRGALVEARTARKRGGCPGMDPRATAIIELALRMLLVHMVTTPWPLANGESADFEEVGALHAEFVEAMKIHKKG